MVTTASAHLSGLCYLATVKLLVRRNDDFGREVALRELLGRTAHRLPASGMGDEVADRSSQSLRVARVDQQPGRIPPDNFRNPAHPGRDGRTRVEHPLENAQAKALR